MNLVFAFCSFCCIIRALVDMLRHQSSPVQQDERNNSVALAVGDPQGTLGRPPKNLYAPGLPSKDNRCESSGSFITLVNSKMFSISRHQDLFVAITEKNCMLI